MGGGISQQGVPGGKLNTWSINIIEDCSIQKQQDKVGKSVGIQDAIAPRNMNTNRATNDNAKCFFLFQLRRFFREPFGQILFDSLRSWRSL